MLIVSNSYGALTATSANTIQGSRPGFTGQSGAKKLGFKIGNTTYSESEGNLSTATGAINNFNAGLRLDEFVVTNLTASDFSPTADYADADGDLAHPTTPFSMSPRTFEWIDSNNTVISSSNYNQTLGCGSGLNLPLTLKITLPNVKVKSRYGNPSESIPTPLVQEYKIGSTSGICFAKPNSLDWWSSNGTKNSGSATPHTIKAGGYNTAQFDPDWGFKASLSPAFPTTGFPGAEFTLVMIGNPTDYTFSSNDSAVVVDTNGKVTLNSKPSGAVTITATKNGTPHYYTFNPTLWVVPNPTTMNYASAVSACGGTNKIPSVLQLTSKQNASYFTRTIGGGVFGEWGYTTGSSGGTYPSSQWINDLYWTRDSHSARYQLIVRSNGGYGVWYDGSNVGSYAVCLG
ncbi:hypothetical protein RCS94_05665 [Orbaceae bacterium ac157xtp]